MNNIANDNFKTWYLSADPNPDSNTLQSRIDIIKQIITSNRDLEFWFDMLRLYLGIPVKDKANVEKFVKIFGTVDADFPESNNENLVRCLASITLCFKLEIFNDNTNNLLSLAVLNSNFLNQYQTYDAIPVSSFASQYLLNSSILEREIDLQNIVLNLDKIPGTLKDDSFLPTNNAIQSIISELKVILQTNKALAEESNVLWWLFGEFSNTCNSLFKDMELSDLIVIAAKELSEITAFNIAVNSAGPILNKALHIGRNIKSKETSLFKIVNTLSSEMKRELIRGSSPKLSEFTPCLSAFVKSIEASDNNDWIATYKERYSNGDVNKLFSPLNLSIQFYREFLFLKSPELK